MITASHNPLSYNGFKMCGKKGEVISYVSGGKTIETLMSSLFVSRKKGKLVRTSYHRAYYTFLRQFVVSSPVALAVDTGEMMGLYDSLFLQKFFCVSLYDGNSHGVNPHDRKQIRPLQHFVRSCDADLGLMFDGDADRVVFIDNHGKVIPEDIVGVLLASFLCQKGDVVVVDVASTRLYERLLGEKGITVVRSKVGRSHLAALMRTYHARFGAEKSGHYFFKEFFYLDNACLAVLYVLQLLQVLDRVSLHSFVRSFDIPYQLGECVFRVKDSGTALLRLRKSFSRQKHSFLDGITIEGNGYWFNVRKSNTEDLFRLNGECDSLSLHTKLLKRITKILER